MLSASCPVYLFVIQLSVDVHIHQDTNSSHVVNYDLIEALVSEQIFHNVD